MTYVGYEPLQYNPDCEPSQLIAFWEKYYPPTKRLKIVELVNIMMNVSAIQTFIYFYLILHKRTLLSSEELASITCPVLIIQVLVAANLV